MDDPSRPQPAVRDVRSFWDANPLSASAIPYPLGSPDYYRYYDSLREANESLEFSCALHEYPAFAGCRVLDVGCGNGYVLSKYAAEGACVTGIDLSRTAIGLSRRRFELAGLQGNFINTNAEQLPFAPASFDLITSMGVLHHVPDTVQAVKEIHRILKPGGRFILMMYYRESALYRFRIPLIRRLTGKSVQQQVNEVDGVGNPKGDVYSKSELAGLLSDFEDIRLEVGLLQGWMLLPRGGRLIPSGLLKPLAKKWGWFLYAKARKPAL